MEEGDVCDDMQVGIRQTAMTVVGIRRRNAGLDRCSMRRLRQGETHRPPVADWPHTYTEQWCGEWWPKDA